MAPDELDALEALCEALDEHGISKLPGDAQERLSNTANTRRQLANAGPRLISEVRRLTSMTERMAGEIAGHAESLGAWHYENKDDHEGRLVTAADILKEYKEQS